MAKLSPGTPLWPFSAIWTRVMAIAVAAVLLLAVFTVPGCLRKRNERLKAAALLSQVSYMEQLHLVTYFYEELLSIGTTSRFEEQVRDLEARLEAVQKNLLEADFQKALAEGSLQKIQADLDARSNRDSIQAAEQKVAVAVERFQQIDLNFSRVLLALRANAEAFTPGIQTRFMVYQEADRRFSEAPARQKSEFRKIVNQALDELRNEWEQEKEQRRQTRNLYQTEYQALLRQARDAGQAVQRDLRKAQNELDQTASRVARVRRERDELDFHLKNAQAEWEARRRERLDDSEPRLITVANAQITGYLDLRELRSEFRADTLVFFLPQPRTDSVRIQLDSSRLYQLMRDFRIERNFGGLYYDLFKQVQLAIREASADVRAKAVERGILEETLEMGERYLRELSLSLGKPVRIIRPGAVYPGAAEGAPLSTDTLSVLANTRRLPDSLLR